MNRRRIVVTLGSIAALCGILMLASDRSPAARSDGAEPATNAQPPSQEEEIQRLKDRAPDQAHAMVSVAYHFGNLWFAGEAENWPLAEFYWNETQSHLRWAVRIIPKRKDSAGKEVDLAPILQALENSPMKQLRDAIKAKQHADFVAAYHFTLEGCYACHKASEKPYLRLQLPKQPAEPLMNFDPEATWPR